jgi:hypothetical protein
LDGVSVTFAMLAFRAVRRKKPPDRCYRVVWGAALASATISFAHEYGVSGNPLAGGYVGLLSLFGMVMFDEFLAQFEDGAATVHRDNPKFGIRWITWPSNTLLAAIAWRNHPPAEGTSGTVANAVDNLNRVRQMKRAARRARQSPTQGPVTASTFSSAGPARNDDNSVAPVAVGTEVVPVRSSRPIRRPAPSGGRRSSRGEDDVPVPVTAAKVVQWVKTWISMCEDPAAADAALKDDDAARARFGCSSRQLRHVRYAVTTGALGRRASELGVDLPSRFADPDFRTD